MSSFAYRRIPSPFELRSSLKGFGKPFSENWAMGNRSSSFVFGSRSMSTFLAICDDKKPNLSLKESILSWAIIGRFLLFTLKFSRKLLARDVFLLLLDKADSGPKNCSGVTSLLFKIFGHPLVFPNFSITTRKFSLKSFQPHWLKCKLLSPRCKTFTSLLCTLSIFVSRRLSSYVLLVDSSLFVLYHHQCVISEVIWKL